MQVEALHKFNQRRPPPGVDNNTAFVNTLGSLVAPEIAPLLAPLHDIRSVIVRLYAAYGCRDIPDCERGYAEHESWAAFRKRINSSGDGRFWTHHPTHIKACVSGILALASADNVEKLSTQWLDALPAADSPTLTCTGTSKIRSVNAPVLIAEVMEGEGRLQDALRFAMAEVTTPQNFNSISCCRAHRTIGRCHEALGQHELAVAASDQAAQLAPPGPPSTRWRSVFFRLLPMPTHPMQWIEPR